MSTKRYIDFQAIDLEGRHIKSSGGMALVTEAGSQILASLTDLDGDSLTQPVALDQGRLFCAVDKSIESVDVFFRAPGGQFRVLRNVTPGDRQEVLVDTSRLDHVYVIPFDIDDDLVADNTEIDTGIELPTDALVLPASPAVLVKTADASETINVGILSGESGGDADGFIAGVSLASLGAVEAVEALTAGGTETYFSASTLGALLGTFLAGANTAGDVGTAGRKAFRCDGTAKTISYTLSSGVDTGSGYIFLPVRLPNVMA